MYRWNPIIAGSESVSKPHIFIHQRQAQSPPHSNPAKRSAAQRAVNLKAQPFQQPTKDHPFLGYTFTSFKPIWHFFFLPQGKAKNEITNTVWQNMAQKVITACNQSPCPHPITLRPSTGRVKTCAHCLKASVPEGTQYCISSLLPYYMLLSHSNSSNHPLPFRKAEHQHQLLLSHQSQGRKGNAL